MERYNNVWCVRNQITAANLWTDGIPAWEREWEEWVGMLLALRKDSVFPFDPGNPWVMLQKQSVALSVSSKATIDVIVQGGFTGTFCTETNSIVRQVVLPQSFLRLTSEALLYPPDAIQQAAKPDSLLTSPLWFPCLACSVPTNSPWCKTSQYTI